MTIDLSSIHVLHCVFGLIRVAELNIAEPTTVLRMETVGRKLDGLDLAINAEDFDDMVLGDVARQSSNVDAGRP